MSGGAALDRLLVGDERLEAAPLVWLREQFQGRTSEPLIARHLARFELLERLGAERVDLSAQTRFHGLQWLSGRHRWRVWFAEIRVLLGIDVGRHQIPPGGLELFEATVRGGA